MSKYSFTGTIKNYKNNRDIHLSVNDKDIQIQGNGEFEIEVDIFKGQGGRIESERLDIPLLGKINLDPLLSVSADSGVPYVVNKLNTYNYLEFDKIAKKILSI